MMPLLAHVTESEYPLGLALFLGGLGVGIGIGVGLGVMKYFRSREATHFAAPGSARG